MAIHDSVRLEALIKNKWVVGVDPSKCFKPFIVTNPFRPLWPECVVADGYSEREAIDNAIQTIQDVNDSDLLDFAQGCFLINNEGYWAVKVPVNVNPNSNWHREKDLRKALLAAMRAEKVKAD